MKTSSLLVVLAPVLFFACSHSKESFQQESCNREIGYEHGHNDGREKKPMDSTFFGPCTPEGRKEAMLGYREGYEAAQRQNDEKGINADESGIRVKVPGVNINLPNKAAKAWSCEVQDPGGQTYTGFGPTRSAAVRDARSACEKKQQSSASCTQVNCEKASEGA